MPDKVERTIHLLPGRENGNLMPDELLILTALAISIEARTIFEFGTFRGHTSWTLAHNIPEAHIWTLDLPWDMRGSTKYNCEEAIGQNDVIFRGTDEQERITELIGNSFTFDYSDLPEMDLVFIDAGHEYRAIRNDTEAALEYLHPKVIAWHDFGNPATPGVTRYIKELRCGKMHLNTSVFEVFEGTRLVVAGHV